MAQGRTLPDEPRITFIFRLVAERNSAGISTILFSAGSLLSLPSDIGRQLTRFARIFEPNVPSTSSQKHLFWFIVRSRHEGQRTVQS